jgi:hypothetical protein
MPLDARNKTSYSLGGITVLDRFLADIRDQDAAHPFLPAESRLLRLCVNTLTAESPQERKSAKLEAAREKCRAGNPFSLLALHDPTLRLRLDNEVSAFNVHRFLPRFEHLPAYLLDPLLDSANPPLRLDWWQKIILVALFSQPIGELYIKGCTGAGKGAVIAMGICLWYDAFPESRTHITSRSFEHAQRNMFGEVVNWARRFRFPPETLLGQSIGESQRHYIKILNPAITSSTAGEAFSGAHGPNTLYEFDEGCHDDKTEVLTGSGWKLFCNLTAEDELLTMNQETHEAFYARPKHIICWPYKGKMYHYRPKGFDFCVTPDHRMLYRSCSREVYGDWQLGTIQSIVGVKQILNTIKWRGVERPEHTLARIPTCEKGGRKEWPERRIPMDLWLEWLGWYLSEGHIAFQLVDVPYSVAISQRADRTAIVDRLVKIATEMGYSPKIRLAGEDRAIAQVYVHNKQFAMELSRCGRGFLNKAIPRYVMDLSPRQIRIFLDAFLLGDGYRRKGRDVFYTSSPQLANDLHELCLKAGYKATITKRKMNSVGRKINGRVVESKHDGYVVTSMESSRESWYSASKAELIDYDGLVWCADLPPCHVMFTRRNGRCLWSGNSSVPDEFVANAQKNAQKIVATSNPRTLHGWFRDGFRPLADREDQIGVCPGTLGMRLCVTVGGPDCMNVSGERLRRQVAPKGGLILEGQTFDEGTPIPPLLRHHTNVLISNQIDLAQFRAITAKNDKREVDVFGYGKFPKEDPSKQVIMGSWLGRHFDAWKADAPPKVDCFGLDVARSLDGDSTCLAAGGATGLRALHLWQYNDTTYHTDRVIQIAREIYGIDLTAGQTPVCVDMDGLGAGVGDQLKLKRVWVIEFRGNARAQVDVRKYANLRTEGYALLGRRLDPDDRWASQPWAMPNDSGLAAELCAPEKVYWQDALRFNISPKRKPPGVAEGGRTISVAEKLGRSPDKADGVVYLFCAVRLLHQMNEYFAAATAPLVVSGDENQGTAKVVGEQPAEVRVASEIVAAAAAKKADEAKAASVAAEQGKAATSAVPQPANRVNDFFAYLMEAYGGGSGVGGGGGSSVGGVGSVESSTGQSLPRQSAEVLAGLYVNPVNPVSPTNPVAATPEPSRRPKWADVFPDD